MSSVTTINVAPRPIALARILLGIAIIMVTGETIGIAGRLADGHLRVPVIGTWTLPSDVVLGQLLLTALAGLCIAIGVGVGGWAVVVFLSEIALLLADQQYYSNHRFLLILLVGALIFAQSGAALSPGAKRRGTDQVPWWPQLLMLSAVSSCYLFAGLSKINPLWWQGTQLDDLRWIDLTQPQLHVLAALTIVTEVAIGLGLWWRRTRLVVVLLGLGLHLSIIVLLGSPYIFTAFALLCFSVYPLVLTGPHPLQGRTAPPRDPERPDIGITGSTS